MAKRPQSLDEFWPYYLSEHRSAASRRLHFVGTAGFMTAMGVSAAMNPVRFPLAIAAALAIGKHGLGAEREARPLKHVAAMILRPTLAAPLTFPAGVVFAYACAWVGHFKIEGNRPATFQYPLMSAASDFRMWGHMAMGRLWSGDPLEELGLEEPLLHPADVQGEAAVAAE